MNQLSRLFLALALVCFLNLCAMKAQDVAGSQDPPNMKRYEGSELIGYRAPKFDEYLLPLGAPTDMYPPKYVKSLPLEGQVSYYTYMAPEGRSVAEFFRNYKQEFQRLNLEVLYTKDAGQHGWFGPTYNKIAEDSGVQQILAYNEAEERMIVGKDKDSGAYYVVFVTAYKDGVKPDKYDKQITKGRALAEIVVVVPDVMEKKMVFVNADEMKKTLHDVGKIALYGVYFDTDKDVVKPESDTTVSEIAKLLKADPALKLHVVGHTDNQGKPDYNLELSKRRAANVVAQLTGKYGIAAGRLDSFGCGLYAPVASNEAEPGRAKNRRVELVRW